MRKLPLHRLQAVGLLIFLVVFGSMPLHAATDDVHEIILLHTNDFHGQLIPFITDGETRGGLARIASVVQVYRNDYPNQVLWLDAGDTWYGSNLANLSNGQSVVESLNTAGLDIMVLGNHDFNFGWESVLDQAAQAKFTVLAGNVILPETDESFLPATARYEVGGLTVGILGLVTPDTPKLTNPRNVEGLEFHDPIAVAQQLASQLAVDTDVVIALSHLGLEYDRLLAEAVPEIDVIVSGHSHTRLLEPEVVDGTPIVQAFEWGNYLGVLHLFVGDEGIVNYDGYLVPMTEDLPQDPTVSAAIAAWEARVNTHLTSIVGETWVDLDAETVRTQESNYGNLVADIVREYAVAELALVNSGGIRRSISAGPITLSSLFEAHPFDNTIVGLELTGEQVLAALENSVLHYPHSSGRFLQVSGLSFAFDPSRPPGDRVTEVYIHSTDENPDGAPLILDQVYRVAVIDFMAVGGDDYTMLVDAPVFFGSTTEGGAYLRDIIIAYIEQASPITAEVTGRIHIQLQGEEVSSF